MKISYFLLLMFHFLSIYLWLSLNISGQEQDSFGGGFQRDQSFSGEITELNFWHKVLDENTIKKVTFIKNEIS